MMHSSNIAADGQQAAGGPSTHGLPDGQPTAPEQTGAKRQATAQGGRDASGAAAQPVDPSAGQLAQPLALFDPA
jgi:hypothetical protein